MPGPRLIKVPLIKQLGNVAKLKGISFYWKMIANLGRHKSTKFTHEGRVVDKALRSPFLTIQTKLVDSMRLNSLSELL